jgi:membrane dipeptidase
MQGTASIQRRARALRPALAIAVLGCAVSLGCSSDEDAEPQRDPALIEHAAQLHRSAIVIDTHSDTTPYFQSPDWDFRERHSKFETHMDLPRIREGGLDAQFWSIYMGAREGDGRAIREALERIDAVHQLADANDEIVLATTAADIRRAAAQGRFASLMGVEGGHIIEDSLAALRTYYRLGVRYMTLTHSFHTSWADSSGTVQSPDPIHGGLTDFGREVVLEMNRLGMMIDVSHVSDATFADTLAVTRAPVIASHSSFRAVADHPRNLSDEMLLALAANGGVAMVNFYSAYIDEEAAAATRIYYKQWGPRLKQIGEDFADADMLAKFGARREHYRIHPMPQAALSVLVDHIEHAIERVGPDHVGLGADWDGVSSLPVGMEEISDLPKLTLELVARGHSDEVLRKLLGENLLRVMAEVEAAAAATSAPPTQP